MCSCIRSADDQLSLLVTRHTQNEQYVKLYMHVSASSSSSSSPSSQHQARLRLQTMMSMVILSRHLGRNLPKSSSTTSIGVIGVLSSEVYDVDKQVNNMLRTSTTTTLKTTTKKSIKTSMMAADDPEWKFFNTAHIHVTGSDGSSG
jgi:hypothetical protein